MQHLMEKGFAGKMKIIKKEKMLIKINNNNILSPEYKLRERH